MTKREVVIYEIANRQRCFSVTSRVSTLSDNVSYAYALFDQPKNKYEIPPELLSVDRTAELGKGAFAVVFKGIISIFEGFTKMQARKGSVNWEAYYEERHLKNISHVL